IIWSEANFWCSPEQHGNLTGIMKTMIDHVLLSLGSVRPTQGKTLAVAQVNGGSQSFNAVNALRILGRWVRMFTIPNQASLPKAWTQFDELGRMLPSSNRDRVVDVCEELVKVSCLFYGKEERSADRWSERREK
ncbi:NADPH-dependent FMN reductase, partial [Tilletiaria anomala UBC 951]